MAYQVERRQGLTVKPTSVWGTLSLGFGVGFVALFAFFIGAAISGQKGGDTLPGNLWLFLPGLGSSICALATGICGLIGLVSRTERSILVIVATVFSGLIALFLAGEFLIP